MHGRSSALLILPAALLVSCATRRLSPAPSSLAAGPYVAAIRMTLSLGGRDVAASGTCLCDPGRGARIELRDPMGATRLLLIVFPGRTWLIAPASRQSFSWTEASHSVPWSGSDLWFILAGKPPLCVSSWSERGGALTARWENGAGRVKASCSFSLGALCPFESATLEGARGARLALFWRDVQPASSPLAEDVFSPPVGMEEATAAEVLAGAWR